ncbi:MAG TPA: YggT family protein [bacterium]|nr:YggT family protein [bacterium]
MLFLILHLFFTALIVVLFVRYFIERYQYYGFGPILVTLVTLTERIMQPFKQYIPRESFKFQEQMPLLVIGVTLLIQGLALWLFGAGYTNDFMRIHSVDGSFNILEAILVSFGMGIVLITELVIAFLFASMMISRRGLMMSGNAGFACFQENTFAIFQTAGRWIKNGNLVTLFLTSSAAVWLAGSLSSAVVSGVWIHGGKAFGVTVILSLFEILLMLIHVYLFVLLLAILASWIAADPFSIVLQIVRAMSDPYLNFFRRLFPWARIDFVDLSPVFAFLFLHPCVVYGLMSIKESILRSILTL